MCTLSWIRTENSYRVFFNRDEKRTRKHALLPKCQEFHGVKVLMPQDPDGGGSWISVNEHGLSLYLLNYYQGCPPSGKLISRGKLLRSLAHLKNLHSVNNQLITMNLTHYAPFTLVVFEIQKALESNSGASYNNQLVFQWNGETMQLLTPQTVITSSSVKFEEVSERRYARYTQQVQLNTAKEHIAFHTGHDGDKNYHSVCMHREDAKTVSFSDISVEPNNITFQYHDGSPCEPRHPNVTNTLVLNSLKNRNY